MIEQLVDVLGGGWGRVVSRGPRVDHLDDDVMELARLYHAHLVDHDGADRQRIDVLVAAGIPPCPSHAVTEETMDGLALGAAGGTSLESDDARRGADEEGGMQDAAYLGHDTRLSGAGDAVQHQRLVGRERREEAVDECSELAELTEGRIAAKSGIAKHTDSMAIARVARDEVDDGGDAMKDGAFLVGADLPKFADEMNRMKETSCVKKEETSFFTSVVTDGLINARQKTSVLIVLLK